MKGAELDHGGGKFRFGPAGKAAIHNDYIDPFGKSKEKTKQLTEF